MYLESILADLNEVLSKGGIIRVKGCTVFVDNPDNLNYYTSATGYYIVSAQGWKVYFKCREDSEHNRCVMNCSVQGNILSTLRFNGGSV